MKILFVEPPYELLSFNSGTIALFEPLGLETIAATVPNHELRLIDLRVEKNEKAALEGFTPDICAFACHSYATMPSTIKTMERYRRMFPNALNLVGGHATLVPAMFNHPAVDAIVLGEGDESFPELVEARAAGRDIAGVPGLALPNRGPDVIFTPERQYSGREMKEYNLPNRSLTKAYRNQYFRYDWRPMAALVTSRGCPHRCDYCTIWKANHGHFRIRSPEDVVAELETIEEPFVTIVDDNMLADLGRVRRFIELIREKGIKKTFSIYARTDTLASHPDIVRDLASIGVRRVLLGVDGFRDEDLKDRNKHNSVENNSLALQNLKTNGIQAIGYFLVRPDYTEKDFDELAAYVRKMEVFQPIFTMLTPMPGTELYDRVKDQLTTHDPRMFDYLHMVLPTRLPLDKFYRCYTKLWRTSHRRSLLRITPAAIRSYLVLRRLYRDHGRTDESVSAPDEASKAAL